MAQIQRTLILVKPDALQRDLVGEIVHRFERKGLKIIGMKMIQLGDAMLDSHYAHIADKPFYADVKQFMMSSPVIAMVLEGVEAISAVRLILGPTKAYEADAGSIRGDLAIAVASNLVHASDSLENAKAEIDRFFDPSEIFTYQKVTDKFFAE
ncbi:MAG: nucleoside-diphosphate kinase [Patescibacteria group bacterium]